MKKILISQKIKEYRRKNHLTQEMFGALLGVSAQSVSKWEREECYPDLFLLVDISNILELSIDELMGKEEFPKIRSNA